MKSHTQSCYSWLAFKSNFQGVNIASIYKSTSSKWLGQQAVSTFSAQTILKIVCLAKMYFWEFFLPSKILQGSLPVNMKMIMTLAEFFAIA